MSSQRDELLAVCAEGNLERVRELCQINPSSPHENATLDALITKAAEKGHADIVRYCLEQGANISYDVITEATEYPEVF